MTDILWVILVDGDQSGGRYSVMEQWMRQGSGPLLHVHGFTDECFYVLDGQMDMQVGDKRITAKEGYSVWVPRRTRARIQGHKRGLPCVEQLYASWFRAGCQRRREASRAARAAAQGFSDA